MVCDHLVVDSDQPQPEALHCQALLLNGTYVAISEVESNRRCLLSACDWHDDLMAAVTHFI